MRSDPAGSEGVAVAARVPLTSPPVMREASTSAVSGQRHHALAKPVANLEPLDIEAYLDTLADTLLRGILPRD